MAMPSREQILFCVESVTLDKKQWLFCALGISPENIEKDWIQEWMIETEERSPWQKIRRSSAKQR